MVLVKWLSVKWVLSKWLSAIWLSAKWRRTSIMAPSTSARMQLWPCKKIGCISSQKLSTPASFCSFYFFAGKTFWCWRNCYNVRRKFLPLRCLQGLFLSELPRRSHRQAVSQVSLLMAPGFVTKLQWTWLWILAYKILNSLRYQLKSVECFKRYETFRSWTFGITRDIKNYT